MNTRPRSSTGQNSGLLIRKAIVGRGPGSSPGGVSISTTTKRRADGKLAAQKQAKVRRRLAGCGSKSDKREISTRRRHPTTNPR